MKKEEFLDGLQQALAGNVTTTVIQENIDYYREYIDKQIQMGRSEGDVITEIGDPRLIAKTIETATEQERRSESRSSNNKSESSSDRDLGNNKPFQLFFSNRWYWKLIILCIIILVILIIGSIFAILVHFSVPIIIILLIIWCFNMIRNK